MLQGPTEGPPVSSSASVPPPPPEPTRAKEIKVVPTTREARAIANVAVRSRAKSELRQIKDRKELRARPAIIKEIVTYGDLASLAEQPNGALSQRIELSGGEPIRVIDNLDGSLRAARPSESDRVFTLATITGRATDNGIAVFTCYTASGSQLSVPVEVLLDAQLVGIAKLETAAGENRVLTAEQTTVLNAYLETRYTGKNDAVENMDVDVLRQAGEASGLVTTDSLRQFLTQHTVEHQAKEGETLTPAQETANQIRQELLTRLEAGTIASAADIAYLIKVYGPTQIGEAVQELRTRAQNLARDANIASGEVREATQKQINELVEQIQALENSQSGLLSPGDQQLEQLFVGMENGDIPTEVGQRISGALKSGNLGQAVEAIIEEKVNQLPKEDPRKKAWEEKVKNITRKTLFAGGGIGALILYLALMGGKKE
ncbi:hypothetical protein A3I50_01360 [Candidatus Roizmanbacteria bacterium RIFCSPLOWO2_02_FULL_37_9]|nr:MAG: hypothetical protein A3I50_01360 [Candidatus Roizmanbacteria bacterium RIFCSPLOWO2_02_FULL_37_9]